MAGINVPQYNIFKIGTKKLKYHDWNLNITEKEAERYNEIVALFEGQEFRIIAKILGKNPRDVIYKNYILSVSVENPRHFSRVVSDDGIVVNGITYKRFLGTTGGLKNNTLLLVNVEILDELNRMVDCERDMSKPIVPAKLEAYKALTCSASQPIPPPKDILVITDVYTYTDKQTVEYLNDTEMDKDLRPVHITKTDYIARNNATDGFNLCTAEYMDKVARHLGYDRGNISGVCMRNAWLKGMLFPFPIREFADTYSPDNYIVKDIWGNEHDIREVEMILTESSLKLWDSYNSINDYLCKTKRNGYEFAVTKIVTNELEDQREINYQYIQSYDFTDDDIKELCHDTVQYLKNALCGDYDSVIQFLGIVGNVRSEDKDGWQDALKTNKYMMNDPFIIDSVYKMIKRKINQAKIGKLLVDGNYQILSGDPFLFMQHVCGIEENGLLKKNECYSNYWINKNVDVVAVYRSPMLVHNNICKLNVSDTEDTNYWYRYMKSIFIINAYDTSCQALSGADADGDLVFSTNNKVLVDRYEDLPAIVCEQKNADKKIPTEEDMIAVEKNGMGNKVGTITNRITSMIERMEGFDKDSEEYKELHYRTLCGQLYQQNEIDKLKGIISHPMPNSWYNYKGCNGDEFLKSICAEKKPYFMIYVYDDYRVRYRNYINEANKTALTLTKQSLDTLLSKNKELLTDDEKQFIDDFNKWNAFGMNPCTMNRVCWYIEDEFRGITSKLKQQNKFDYKKILYGVNTDDEITKQILDLSIKYHSDFNRIKYKRLSSNINNEELKEQEINNRFQLKNNYKKLCMDICPDDKMRMDIVMTLAYTEQCHRQFYWDVVGDLVVSRLKEDIMEELNHA